MKRLLNHSLAVLLSAILCQPVSAEPSAALPNIVVVLADDLGWRDVGFQDSEIRTPNIDALAEAGVVLNRFYSQPTCTPTRAALMTGKTPQRVGIFRQIAKNSDHGLPVGERTIADHLRAAGYQTWLVGKWHLGHSKWAYHPTQRGFDHFYGHVTGGIGYWDHVHGGGLDWQRNGFTVREDGYATHLLAQEALDLLARRDPQRPFFLYASFNAPHLPNEAPPEALAAYSEIANPYRRAHAAMVTELDSAIGQIVDGLRVAGELDNTLIWFMSDNGGLNGEFTASGYVTLAETLDDWFDGGPVPVTFLEFVRTNVLEGGADNSPLRYGKGSVYEGGVRVPSLVHWPRHLTPRRSDDIVTVQDVLPTILAATNLPTPETLDGTSQWDALTRAAATTTPDYVVMGQNGEQAYYQWPWKLIVQDDITALYDVMADPLEANDLAAKDPERVKQLSQLLDAHPRAENNHIPIYRVMWDPDFFGGEEDRQPWAELIPVEQRQTDNTATGQGEST